jgi:predicted ribosomally synthesized peptide with nif11-like leader
MRPEDFQALQGRYANDPELRRSVDSAASADDAVRLLAEVGITATASDIAQLTGAGAELDLDTLDAVAGGGAGEYSEFNYTFN